MANLAYEVLVPSSQYPITLIEFILDETGSMAGARSSTIASFNEYINSQRAQPGKCLLTLTKFDVYENVGFSSQAFGGITPSLASIAFPIMAPTAVVPQSPRVVTPMERSHIRTEYVDFDIHQVPQLTAENYNPMGSTNLYDAVAKRIHALTERSHRYQDASKLIVIMTDGHDNASKEYTAESLKSLIEEKETEGWTFVFLGANQDAWEVGKTFGMAQGNTMTYSTDNMQSAMATLSAATTNYRSMRSASIVGSMSASNDFFSSMNKSEGEKE